MKTTSKEAPVMNAGHVALVGVATLIVGAFAVACFESDQDACGKGLIADPKSANCIAAPPPPAPDAGASDSGGANGDAGDDAGAPAEDFFGKTCATAADCGGKAPICAAPQLPICTQINCAAGEANEGVCPAGWTCLVTGGGNPSVCFKQ